QQLGKMGFEVANHTHTHASVTGMSQQQFTDQLKYIEDKCDSLKIGKPVTFAYPGYDVDSNALATLNKSGYIFARAGGSRAYNPLSDNPYLVPSWAVTANNQEQIMNAIQQAKHGKIVVLTFHGIPDYEHSWVTTPPELFKKYLQYLYNNHYKVIALKDLNNYINVKNAQKEIKPDFKKTLKN
ncbi:MAG TPA: polysaccharide deacetylase, partial [Sphingobacteriaceae bacterium]|nr:polysaccharide deacetylase [Sphingobacteriaceae bacterium]